MLKPRVKFLVVDFAAQAIPTTSFITLTMSDALNYNEVVDALDNGVVYRLAVGAMILAANGSFIGYWVKNDVSYSKSTIGINVIRARAIGSNAPSTQISVPLIFIPV